MEKVAVGTSRTFPSNIYIYIDKGALCRNTIKLRAPLILVSRPLASREFVGIGDRREETDKAEFTRGADGPD